MNEKKDDDKKKLEETIKIHQMDIDKSYEIRKIMENEMKKMQENMCELILANSDLKKSKELLYDADKKVISFFINLIILTKIQIYKEKLGEIAMEQEKEQKADFYRKRKIMQEGFICFFIAVKKSQVNFL